METDKPLTNHTKDKVLRFKPIAFLRKNLFVTTVFFLILITNLVGVWNIKKYEIYDISGEQLPIYVQESITKYIEESAVSKNFFSLSVYDLEKELTTKVSYIEDIDIKKSLPNKLELFVRIYKPELVSVLNNNCYILSIEGVVLDAVCKDESSECCIEYAQSNKLYQLVSTSVDISKLENEKEKLLVMDSISKVIRITKSLGFGIAQITLKGDILEVGVSDKQILRFSLGEELDIQLERLIIVAGKIKSDNISFKSLDLRFERPVVKD